MTNSQNPHLLRLRDALAKRPRLRLLDGVTPVQRLTRLEQALECDVAIYVKRDDFMGLGGGGNKLRKLEFLLGGAQESGCDTFITVGGVQSNHARLSAAACAQAGLACELVLTRVVPRRDDTYERSGNVLLDELFGARVHVFSGETDALAKAHELAERLKAEGRRPYVVGSGGSSPVGCLGYSACAGEILEQEETLGLRFSCIALPNGSSGTHSGLIAGMASAGQDPGRLRSWTVLASLEAAREKTAALSRDILDHLGDRTSLNQEAVNVHGNQLGPGYGIPTESMVEAVRLLAGTEGLLVDPVYGGKALAGLIAAIRQKEFGKDEAVLFLMTGGTPGLFVYRDSF